MTAASSRHFTLCRRRSLNYLFRYSLALLSPAPTGQRASYQLGNPLFIPFVFLLSSFLLYLSLVSAASANDSATDRCVATQLNDASLLFLAVHRFLWPCFVSSVAVLSVVISFCLHLVCDLLASLSQPDSRQAWRAPVILFRSACSPHNLPLACQFC